MNLLNIFIATGIPSHTLKQSEAAKFVANLPSIQKNQSRIEKIYQNTRIETRHMAVDLLSDEQATFSRERNTIKARMDMYKEYGIPLAEKVANEAIAKIDSQTTKDDIGYIGDKLNKNTICQLLYIVFLFIN